MLRQTRLAQTVAATRKTPRQHRAPRRVDAGTIRHRLIAVSVVVKVKVCNAVLENTFHPEKRMLEVQRVFLPVARLGIRFDDPFSFLVGIVGRNVKPPLAGLDGPSIALPDFPSDGISLAFWNSERIQNGRERDVGNKN